MKNNNLTNNLKNQIKEYVSVMLNPNYEDDNFEYYGPMKIESIKNYLDENKQEIDINVIKEYLANFGINIFDNNIKDIEKQLVGGAPQNFEQDLELLFREKAFSTYGGDIYDVPRYAAPKIDKLLKKYNQSLGQLVDNNLLVKLAITTATQLLHNDKTDEGYPYQSNFKIGINYLAIELIIKALSDSSEKRENIIIGDAKPFKSSLVVQYNQKIEDQKNSENKTVFEILSQNIDLYNDFQYGSSYDFSEDYYERSLKALNVCLKNMNIEDHLIEKLKPELKEIQQFMEENKGSNTHALKQINNNALEIMATIKMPKDTKKIKVKS